MRRATIGLGGRLRMSAVGGVAAVLAALTVGFNLVLDARLEHDANNVVESRAAAELSALRVAHGRIVLPEAPDESALDSQVWVFEGRRALERPRSSAATDSAAAALAGGPRRMLDVRGAQTRLYAVPVAANGTRVGTVVAGA